MKVAVVILNWNGKDLLQQFLPSVVMHSRDAEVYVADNASSEGSVKYVIDNFPTVKIIENAANYGYAKGYNEALKKVDADIYCLLNSDVEVTENWLLPIIHTFKSEPNTAIIQPKVLDYKNKTNFEYAGAAGGYIDKYGYAFCRGRIFDTLEEDLGQYDDAVSIFWASGACLFIRSSVYKELNGFDESYFAHFEEIDLCWRAFNYNHDAKYIAASTIYHVGGATLNNSNPRKTYLNFRNSLFTITKNADGNIVLKILIRMLLDGVAALKFAFELKFMHILSILKAHISFYKRLPLLMSQRKNLPKKESYYHTRSIIWSYFIDNKKHFDSL